jgi:hypothetical protein
MTKRVSIKSGEPYDVYVGRHINPIKGKWGNPYSHKEGTLAKFKVDSRKEAILKYKKYLLDNPEKIKELEVLKDKTLACWCDIKESCHADIIIELLNKGRLF